MAIPIPLILFMAAVVGAGVAIVIFGSKPQAQRKGASNILMKKMYEFFSTNFLTSGRILKIVDKLSALSIYNRGELQEIATKYFLMSSGISLGIIVMGFILFNDTISIMLCITAGVVINTIMVDKQVEKVNRKVYLALKHAISSIRQEYLRLGSVTEAISEAEIPAMLRKPFDEIYQIFT